MLTRMRKVILTLCGLFLLHPALLAQDAADPITALVPKKGVVIIRVPSLNRLDAMGKELFPLVKGLLDPGMSAMLENATPSQLIQGSLGVPANWIHPDKPIYMVHVPGLTGDQPYVLATAGEGAAIEGEQELPAAGVVVSLTDGVLHFKPKGAPALEARGTPINMVDGDFAFHIELAELVDAKKADIEGALGMAAGMAQMFPIPQGLAKLIVPMLDLVRGVVYGVQSIDYTFTWKGEIVESVGRIIPREGSGFHKLMQRAGAPGDNSLSGYLPKDAFVIMDYSLNADWPGREAKEFFTAALGGEAGEAVINLMGPTQVFWENATGRVATSVTLQGMMQSTISLMEIKEGSAAKIFESWDSEKISKAMAQLGLPMTIKLEMNAGQHGETALHKMTIESDDPMIAGVAGMMQTYMAAEGSYVFYAQSMAAEQDLRALIDAVRKGEPGENPHTAAMARLGRKRNIGITLNVSQAKQFAGMLMFVNPMAAQALGNLPDGLTTSTAITFDNGTIHWRGDWPVKKMVGLVEAMRGEGKEEPAPAPAEDEDFD